MAVKDHHGLTLSGASAAAAELYRDAVQGYYCYTGEPIRWLNRATADSPAFVMAHLLKAYLTLVGSNTAVRAMGAAAYAAAKDLPATPREQGHRAAVAALLAGELRAAGRILEDIAVAEPLDVLALQAGQMIDFLTGDSRMLRDRVARVLPAWSDGMEDHHAILGMHAFGLEETGLYDRAEAAGRRAIELQPRNGWAQHAVAHVLEMQDRREEGIAWMLADPSRWTEGSLFAVHNWWHLTLFHLGLDDTAAALAVYDGPLYGPRSNLALDMVDAAALLWRLTLRGVDVGDRWAALADIYASEPRGLYAFDDAHAMMAFVGAGRNAEARQVVEALKAAAGGAGDNAVASRDVGLPVAEAIGAYGHGDFGRAVDLLRDVRRRAAGFGGSHAQRDILDLTLIAAAGKSGDTSLERALLAERTQARRQAA
jgi:hypothetical protein